MVVLQDGQFLRMAAAVAALDIPIVAYFHGLEFEDWDTPGKPFNVDQFPATTYVANSTFTAELFVKRYGVMPTIVHPVCRPERYLADWSPSNVTFINPVSQKGLDLVIAIAQLCPEIPFVFVKGWPLSIREAVALRAKLRPLRNVKLVDRTGDMRSVYGQCRILLVPSVWSRETWGRVASEAQVTGIPVLGSNVGGLPESSAPAASCCRGLRRPKSGPKRSTGSGATTHGTKRKVGSLACIPRGRRWRSTVRSTPSWSC